MKHGIFVAFEGTAKGGKKTQSKLLADALTQISGKETLYIHFPDKSTPTGKMIEKYQTGELKITPRVAHLLYAANRWEHQEEISKSLSAGVNVVVDRYAYSGVVNTAASLEPLFNVDWEWCRRIESGMAQPDVIFCLTAENLSEIASREGFGEQASETVAFQTRVMQNYARLCRELTDESNPPTSDTANQNGDSNSMDEQKPKLWNWIEASGQSVDDVHLCIMTIIDPLL